MDRSLTPRGPILTWRRVPLLIAFGIVLGVLGWAVFLRGNDGWISTSNIAEPADLPRVERANRCQESSIGWLGFLLANPGNDFAFAQMTQTIGRQNPVYRIVMDEYPAVQGAAIQEGAATAVVDSRVRIGQKCAQEYFEGGSSDEPAPPPNTDGG